MAETYVLDSFAILAVLGREAGGDQVADLLRRAQVGEAHLMMTWVNVGEVAYIVERRHGSGRLYEVLGLLGSTAIEFVPVGRSLALRAAGIKAGHALAYADAFAAALAASEGAVLVTGDPEFKPLEGTVSIHWLPRGA